MKVQASSSMEAEFHSLCLCARELVHLRTLYIRDFRILSERPHHTSVWQACTRSIHWGLPATRAHRNNGRQHRRDSPRQIIRGAAFAIKAHRAEMVLGQIHGTVGSGATSLLPDKRKHQRLDDQARHEAGPRVLAPTHLVAARRTAESGQRPTVCSEWSFILSGSEIIWSWDIFQHPRVRSQT